MSEGAAKKEEKPRKFQAIRGTRDLLPPETALWNRVEQTAHEVFATFGFGEIRLPIFEPTELFARAVGGETDIVSKEMYTFDDPPTTGFLLDEDSLNFVNAQNSPERMERLLSGLEASVESGEIANTDENRNAISSIRSVSKELFAIPEPSEEGPEDVAMERLFAYFDQRKPFEKKLRDAWFLLHKRASHSRKSFAMLGSCCTKETSSVCVQKPLRVCAGRTSSTTCSNCRSR